MNHDFFHFTFFISSSSSKVTLLPFHMKVILIGCPGALLLFFPQCCCVTVHLFALVYQLCSADTKAFDDLDIILVTVHFSFAVLVIRLSHAH